MKLSIIIPTYNTNETLLKLLQALERQMQPNIEVIVVDDCSDRLLKLEFPNWVKFIRLEENSGGASRPRNIGLDNARGEYIAFIDSDDMVSEDYIKEILKKIRLDKDIIFLSWKSQKHNIMLHELKRKPSSWNCSVWCRVYKKSLIGKTRFKENLRIAEDWEFNTHIHPTSSTFIKKQIYYYNIRENSLSRRNK